MDLELFLGCCICDMRLLWWKFSLVKVIWYVVMVKY